MLSGGTRALCPHWREAHLRLSDLAAGPDPAAGATRAGANPCTGGGIAGELRSRLSGVTRDRLLVAFPALALVPR